jgi:hypothetical protein
VRDDLDEAGGSNPNPSEDGEEGVGPDERQLLCLCGDKAEDLSGSDGSVDDTKCECNGSEMLEVVWMKVMSRE